MQRRNEATLDQTSASVHRSEGSPTPAFIHPLQRTCIECRTCVSCLQIRAGLCPENTPRSSQNETVTLLNTQWTHCVNSRHTFPNSTSLLFLSFLFSHLFVVLSSPLGYCEDPDAATSAEYQHTLNAISLKFSRELMWGEECGREMKLKADPDTDSIG